MIGHTLASGLVVSVGMAMSLSYAVPVIGCLLQLGPSPAPTIDRRVVPSTKSECDVSGRRTDVADTYTAKESHTDG